MALQEARFGAVRFQMHKKQRNRTSSKSKTSKQTNKLGFCRPVSSYHEYKVQMSNTVSGAVDAVFVKWELLRLQAYLAMSFLHSLNLYFNCVSC